MAKIVDYKSFGPEPLDPDMQPASLPPDKVEITLTPEPKTRKQRQPNAKARGIGKVLKRQQANSYAQRSESRTTAQRKRKRDLYYHTVQADLAAGKITEEQAKERLPKRLKSVTTEA